MFAGPVARNRREDVAQSFDEDTPHAVYSYVYLGVLLDNCYNRGNVFVFFNTVWLKGTLKHCESFSLNMLTFTKVADQYHSVFIRSDTCRHSSVQNHAHTNCKDLWSFYKTNQHLSGYSSFKYVAL